MKNNVAARTPHKFFAPNPLLFALRGTGESKKNDRVARVIRYLNWKVEYASRHNMLSLKLISADLVYLTSFLKQRKDIQEEYANHLVYEVIAYL